MHKLRLLLLAASTLAGASTALAAWPEKPVTIKMTLGTGSGGPTDIAARTIGPFLEKYLGPNATVVTINMPGAGGEVGFAKIANSPPDGTTIGLAAMPNLVARVVEKTPPNYTIDSLSYLGFLDTGPAAIVVPPNSQFKTLGELMDYAKAHPGAVKIGVGAIGADNHLVLLDFMRKYNVELSVIPFGGDDTARNAVMGDQVMAASLSAISANTFSDSMRTLAVAAESRLPFMPDVPTARELGYDIVGGASRGFIAPAGLPADVRESLIDAIEKSVKDPEFLAAITKQGIQLSPRSAEEYEKYIRDQYTTLTDIYKQFPWNK